MNPKTKLPSKDSNDTNIVLRTAEVNKSWYGLKDANEKFSTCRVTTKMTSASTVKIAKTYEMNLLIDIET